MFDTNSSYGASYDLTTRVSAVMKKVYVKMMLALLVSAAVAYFVAASPAMMNLIYGSRFGIWALIIVEFGLVIGISGAINRLSSSAATGLFYLFAAVNGATLSSILYLYEPTAIFKTFLITSGTFGAMSVYGYSTNKDLTRFGSILVMALLGLIICTIVNIFLKSDTMMWIISGVGVLIFIGLTAWDTQQIKRMAIAAPDASVGKLGTLGALSLYLDFINLFLYLLRFFGGSRD